MIKGLGMALAGVGVVAGSLLGIAMLTKFEWPPITTVQRGYRGTGMEQGTTPRQIEKYMAENVVPASLPQASAAGPKAGAVYKNVQVLGDLSVGQFTRLMVSITQWVSPKQGCNYCHNPENMAWDGIYTKVVARRMIQMTQFINAEWQPHVQQTGVVCYTCHRGNNVPNNIWFNDPGNQRTGGVVQANMGMGQGVTGSINNSSLPYDPYTPFLEKDYPIRQQGETALPAGNNHSIKETEWTYALMIHFSQGLGVNCTYCHNSRAFGDWSQSSPTRVTAWHGIRMVRQMNNEYLNPLQPVYPDYRLGKVGDAPKVACATCHQGVFKPLYGVSMLKNFPELSKPGPQKSASLQ